jgi:hypothetical protein
VADELDESLEKAGHVVKSLEGLARDCTCGAIWSKSKAYGVFGKDRANWLGNVKEGTFERRNGGADELDAG